MGPELQGECHVEGQAKRSRQTEVRAVVSDKQGSRSAKTCRKLSAFSANISQVAAMRNQAGLTLLSKWLRPGPESLHKALCCPAKASKRFELHLKSNPKRLHHQTCWDDMACNGHHSRHTHLPCLSRLSWHIMATHIGR